MVNMNEFMISIFSLRQDTSRVAYLIIEYKKCLPTGSPLPDRDTESLTSIGYLYHARPWSVPFLPSLVILKVGEMVKLDVEPTFSFGSFCLLV